MGQPPEPRPVAVGIGGQGGNGQIRGAVEHGGLHHQTPGHRSGRAGRADQPDHTAVGQPNGDRHAGQRRQGRDHLDRGRSRGTAPGGLQGRVVGDIGGADAQHHEVGVGPAALPASHRGPFGPAGQLGRVGGQPQPPAVPGRPGTGKDRLQALDLASRGPHRGPVGPGGPAAALQPGPDGEHRPQRGEHGHDRRPHQRQHRPGGHRQENACPRQRFGVGAGWGLGRRGQRRGLGRRHPPGRPVERNPAPGRAQAGPDGGGHVVGLGPPRQAGGPDLNRGSKRDRGRLGQSSPHAVDAAHGGGVAGAEVGQHRRRTRPHPQVAPGQGRVVDHQVAAPFSPYHPGIGRRHGQAVASPEPADNGQDQAGFGPAGL